MKTVAPWALIPSAPAEVAPWVRYILMRTVPALGELQVPWKNLVPEVVLRDVQKLTRCPDWTRGPDCLAKRSMLVCDGEVKSLATMELLALEVLNVKVKIG